MDIDRTYRKDPRKLLNTNVSRGFAEVRDGG